MLLAMDHRILERKAATAALNVAKVYPGRKRIGGTTKSARK
jgi:tRNA isopentenyl-2-thiomethyl-A-37 hydroxylase MiaE